MISSAKSFLPDQPEQTWAQLYCWASQGQRSPALQQWEFMTHTSHCGSGKKSSHPQVLLCEHTLQASLSPIPDKHPHSGITGTLSFLRRDCVFYPFLFWPQFLYLNTTLPLETSCLIVSFIKSVFQKTLTCKPHCHSAFLYQTPGFQECSFWT